MKDSWNKFNDVFGKTIFHPQFIIKKYTTSWCDYKRYITGDVLDIGCGRMEYQEKILETAKSYTGLDFPKTATLYKPNQKPNILADAHKLPIKNNTYDTVLLLQSLEYMENPLMVLTESNRVLKKEGSLILTVPFLYPIHDYPHDKYRFTDTSLKNLLTDANYKIEKLVPQGGFIEVLIQLFLVFYFKTSKELLRKGMLSKILTYFLLLFALPITVFGNLLAFFLSPIVKKSPADRGFVLNYLIIAKKK